MRIHMIGISGTGMGALAGLLLDAGHEVSGSDLRFDPPIGDLLRSSGARLLQGFAADHVEAGIDLVIVGNVCRSTNVEAVRAGELGLRRASMPGTVDELFLRCRRSFVIAGTHGKTTTTSLVAHVLHSLGRDPSFLVGGVPANFGTGHRLGHGKDFVIEGDEYDSAFFEKVPKMWRYRPWAAVVTSMEHDHVDIYPTADLYAAAFRRFVELLPEEGLLVLNADSDEVVALAAHSVARVVTFGLGDARGSADFVATPRPSGFDLVVRGQACGRYDLAVPGRHNVANAAAAVAVCHEALSISFDDLRPALASFRGVKRRQELVGTPGGVRLYDDFAHHPTEVAATLAALAGLHPTARLCAVFEPRSATACRRLHQEAYAGAFDAAAEVLVARVGRPDLPAEEQLDVGRLVSDLRSRGLAAQGPLEIDEIVGHVVAAARPGDVVAVLSNGSFGGIHEALRRALDAAR
ncbi:MAG: UDP-N-acetylmuramate:L-alanyl-gamma-D-glutamyl-meso-diaminopimelate ligase [Deltaproteobacteria bacterium]|nr:UDP-N-acetylmuramate:L-alanyl-gamma-D-glutamyl-meso-diaminopimelate ligase [Deltaproteobacteria bacterium]